MSTDTDKYEAQTERDAPHSALEEFSRDERRPAVILLSALILAATFFAIGIMFGRWTADTQSPVAPAASTQTMPSPPPPPTPVASAPQQSASAQASTSARPTEEKQRRYALLISDLKSKEAADALARTLERAGYKDVRIRQRAAVAREGSQLSLLIGRYTRDEAEAEAGRLKQKGGPRTKSVRVVEDPAL